MVEVLVPLGFFLMAATISVAAIVFGARAKRDQQETLRQLAQSGQPLTPELIASLSKPGRAPEQDLRSGLILLMLALGFAGVGLMEIVGVLNGDGGEGAARGFFIAALIVGSIGVGQLLSWWLRRDRSR